MNNNTYIIHYVEQIITVFRGSYEIAGYCHLVKDFSPQGFGKKTASLGLLNQFEGYDFCLRGKKEYSIVEIFSFSKGRLKGHDNKRV